MALNGKVTASEFDQTLRAAVNAYYEHALNDPSMSKEEAMKSTYEMAERYLNAVDGFNANVEAEQAAEVAGEVGMEAGETGGLQGDTGGVEGGSNGGMEGGDTGGIGGGE